MERTNRQEAERPQRMIREYTVNLVPDSPVVHVVWFKCRNVKETCAFPFIYMLVWPRPPEPRFTKKSRHCPHFGLEAFDMNPASKWGEARWFCL